MDQTKSLFFDHDEDYLLRSEAITFAQLKNESALLLASPTVAVDSPTYHAIDVSVTMGLQTQQKILIDSCIMNLDWKNDRNRVPAIKRFFI